MLLRGITRLSTRPTSRLRLESVSVLYLCLRWIDGVKRVWAGFGAGERVLALRRCRAVTAG
jgi:hypothetical protein